MKIDENKIAYCRKLYIEQNGKYHYLIEKSMREAGYSFTTRCLYRNGSRPGWIMKYGWKDELAEQRVSSPHVSKGSSRAADRSDKNTKNNDSFESWLKTVSPGFNWDWTYQKLVYQKLKDVTEGRTKRLMIFLPPRHGKSELVTVRYTAWRLQQDPTLNVIVGSYNQKLANRFSRRIKTVLSDAVSINAKRKRGETVEVSTILDEPRQRAAIQSVPPADRGPCEGSPSGVVVAGGAVYSAAKKTTENTDHTASPLPRPINTAEEWETRSGGTVRAVGVGGGITGYGAGLIIIDDPVKSRAEAESKTIRDKVFDWFNDDLYTRLEPDAPIILIQTRWHEDDLAGRLLKEAAEQNGEQWEIVSLPAIAEEVFTAEEISTAEGTEDTEDTEKKKETNSTILPSVSSASSAVNTSLADPLVRLPGEPLCPERFSLEQLERIKQKLGTYSFSALYQQRPVPPEGSIFKRNWFKIIDKAPAGLKWKRGYDLAISTRDTADFTASFKCAMDKDGNLYIGDGFRSRMNYPEQRRYIIMKMMQERDVEHGIEDALHGRAAVEELRRNAVFRSVAFRSVRVTEDKITRALCWSTLAEEGKVFLVKANWNKGLIEEAAMFPKGANDDQIDAISIAVGMLSKVRQHYAVGF